MLKNSSLAALALAVAGTFGSAGLALAQTTTAPAGAETAAPAEAKKIEIKDMVLGQETAPVTLIEYASYTCPHCATFNEAVMPQLKKEYVDTGKVKVVYREVFFDRYGLWAAMVARCGGDMRYFGIMDVLYQTQKEWAAGENPGAVVESLKKIGRQAGMDNTTLDACLQDGATAQALVDHYEANMKEYDVKGTPTLVVNGKVHSNMSYADLKEIIDAQLK